MLQAQALPFWLPGFSHVARAAGMDGVLAIARRAAGPASENPSRSFFGIRYAACFRRKRQRTERHRQYNKARKCQAAHVREQVAVRQDDEVLQRRRQSTQVKGQGNWKRWTPFALARVCFFKIADGVAAVSRMMKASLRKSGGWARVEREALQVSSPSQEGRLRGQRPDPEQASEQDGLRGEAQILSG